VSYLDVHRLAQIERNLRPAHGFKMARGHFNQRPGEPAAKQGRQAIHLAGVVHRKAPLSAAVILIDMDEEPPRKNGLEQARQEAARQGLGFAVLLGCPSESIEACLLAALEPRTRQEEERIKEIRDARNLDFDPLEQAHRLSHKEGVPKSSKEILALLTQDDLRRQEEGLRRTEQDLLRSRGHGSGLTDFLDEVAQHLAPQLT
jgi:hypothetical protein